MNSHENSISGQMVGIVIILLSSFMTISELVNFNNIIFSSIRVGIGVIFLIFLPGYFILRCTSFKYEGVRIIIYAVGISLVYDLFLAIIVNYFLLLLKINRPLDPIYMTSIFVGCIIALYYTTTRFTTPTNRKITIPHINLAEKRAILFFSLLLTFAITAVYLRNRGFTQPMLILLLLISITPLLILTKAVPKRVTPFAIYCVALSILYHTSLVTGHIWGWDIHFEYYSATIIQKSGHWDPTIDTETIPLLTITLLSTLFSNIFNISLDETFKIIYPLIFAILPLGIYRLSQQQFESKNIAILAPFVPVFYYGFFKVIPTKQAFGELFFIILIITLLDSDIPQTHQRLLEIMFIIGLIFSHYTMSLLAIIFLTGASCLSFFSRKIGIALNTGSNRIARPMGITILLVFWLAWFSYVAHGINIERVVLAAFYAIVSLVTSSPSTRSGVGYATRNFGSIYWLVYILLSASTVGFLGIGMVHSVFDLLRKKTPTQAYDYAVFSLVVFSFLCLSVVVTFSIGFDRALNIVYVLIAPFTVFGFVTFYTITEKVLNEFNLNHFFVGIDPYLVFGIFLSISLLFSSGAAFAVGGKQVPRYSISLSENVDWPTYTNNEVSAKYWLNTYRNEELPLAVYNWRNRIDSRDGLLMSEIEYRHEIEPIFPQYTVVHNDSYFYMSSQPLMHKQASGYVDPKQTNFYHAASGNLTKIYTSGSGQIYRVQQANYSELGK